MERYTVKQLASIAGVSVRTLHLYDRMGLLTPSIRTEKKYRLYGKPEALRLQQILFYKELGLPLREIADVLDDPQFDAIDALESHRKALVQRQQQLNVWLHTIDKTIDHLKNQTMLSIEDLYEGLPIEASELRQQATEKWPFAVERSETHLRKKTKAEFQSLKDALAANLNHLQKLIGHDPAGENVQSAIREHYELMREFWGTSGSPDKQTDTYTGLADLYLSDERYTTIDKKANRPFAEFLSSAMRHFAKRLKQYDR